MDAIVEITDCGWCGVWIVDNGPTGRLLNEGEALGWTVSDALWMTLGENQTLGLKVDDTFFDILLDDEKLGLTESAVGE